MRLGASLLLILPLTAVCAQSSPPAPPDANGAPAAAAPLVTIHGVVKNTATGDPLARVLVKVENDSMAAALTDGNGAFEIPGVPGGVADIDVTKPGFEDASGSTGESVVWIRGRTVPHAIEVAADMPGLEFAMRPLNAIRGHIQLSSGEPAEGFRVELFKQAVLQGRLQWRVVANRPTSADGAFRFGGLSDGTYTIATQPSIDGGEDTIFPPGGKSPRMRTGYARTFYPDARDLSGSGRIVVSGGQTAQANLTLKEEQFHLVRAAVSGPGLDFAGGGPRSPRGGTLAEAGSLPTSGVIGLTTEVLDTRGHSLPYDVKYDGKSQIVKALLPDGDYSLRVGAFGLSKRPPANSANSVISMRDFLSGQTDFSVNGRAVTNLRIAMGPESSNSLEVLVNRTGSEAPQQGNAGGINVTASQAGADAADPLNAQFAQGNIPGTVETQPLGPGSYWLHASINQAGLCESSFTAGGANLAHEALVVAPNGSTAPLTLTLRDDCASLRVSLPGQLAAPAAGETPVFHVYIVPDFDATTEVHAHILYPGQVNSFVADRLTPGAYRVYALRSSAELPYHDRDAMAALNLQGQAVTLSPGETSDLVVEVPAP
jgi:hypothetical protein